MYMRNFATKLPCAAVMGVKAFFWLCLLLLICGERVSTQSRIRPLKDGVTTNYKSGGYEASSVTHEKPTKHAAPILLKCNEKTMQLLVKADVYNIGIRISSEELVLGQEPVAASSCRAFPFSADALAIEASLHECGSLVTMEGDLLVYKNVLTISPKPTSSGIVRINGAVVPLSCHYQRKHVVSSDQLKPTWASFTSTTAALDLLDFSLRLMSDDWRSVKPSDTYFLGDLLRIEASVSLVGHVPLRLFMDHCVATLTPDLNSVPNYAFIGNHGCLSDATAAGSHTRFMPRSLDNKLQVQIDALVLPEDYAGSSIYIACQLRVTETSQNTDSMNKACSYVDGRWQSVDRNDAVCGCCEATCQDGDRSLSYGQFVSLGPVAVSTKN
ncbi:hypothetical protein AAFF_G00376940 [Aldrovandia affinis]|uniref:Zona pellucida sperm-binding protein 3 n=1 Tax=Aldrovandia affinis TaxID=143900 RepID=A0AAD7SFV9_9TELE|nr:hypothetical protein AAFF_G00376940 [Aldrovandia affinis]